MFPIKLSANDVAVRALLYILNNRRHKTRYVELSNSRLYHFISVDYPELFNSYKDKRSAQSGFAGNLSLLLKHAGPILGVGGQRRNEFYKLLPHFFQDQIQRAEPTVRRDAESVWLGDFLDERHLHAFVAFIVTKRKHAVLNKYVNAKASEYLSRFLGYPVAYPQGLDTNTATLSNYRIYRTPQDHLWLDVLKPVDFEFTGRFQASPPSHNLVLETDHLTLIPEIRSSLTSFEDYFSDGVLQVERERIRPDWDRFSDSLDLDRFWVVSTHLLRERILTKPAFPI